ncbi:MAG: TlpA disulfide reductase family protein [Anaerolineae bacterium]|nr:TlpA disulfide reductase family protein [Anaerolineae bacterium]
MPATTKSTDRSLKPSGNGVTATPSRFTWTLLLVGALLLGSAWILYSREDSAAAAADGLTEAPTAGHIAPDFSLELLNGDTFSLSAMRGQPVVLNFWATWCPPCRVEIPHFEQASRKYNGQVVIAGIDDGEPVTRVRPFVQEMGMTYPVPLDEDSVVSRRYQVNSLPTTFFIGADGVIQNVHIGLINQAVLEEKIESLIQGS